jgi:hypothetical protein
MSTWITAAALLIAAIGVVAQIYFNFVPDLNAQKRQLKKAAWWAWDILGVGAQGYCIYFLAHYKGPVTVGFVVEVALVFSGLALNAVLVLLRRLLAGLLEKHLDNFEHLLDVTDKHVGSFGQLVHQAGRHIEITGQLQQALLVIRDDSNLSADTTQALRMILRPKADSDEADAIARV